MKAEAAKGKAKAVAVAAKAKVATKAASPANDTQDQIDMLQ